MAALGDLALLTTYETLHVERTPDRALTVNVVVATWSDLAAWSRQLDVDGEVSGSRGAFLGLVADTPIRVTVGGRFYTPTPKTATKW